MTEKKSQEKPRKKLRKKLKKKQREKKRQPQPKLLTQNIVICVVDPISLVLESDRVLFCVICCRVYANQTEYKQ